jgi:hypothetical protein
MADMMRALTEKSISLRNMIFTFKIKDVTVMKPCEALAATERQWGRTRSLTWGRHDTMSPLVAAYKLLAETVIDKAACSLESSNEGAVAAGARAVCEKKR